MIIIQGREGIFSRECRDQGMMLEEGGDMLSAFVAFLKLLFFTWDIFSFKHFNRFVFRIVYLYVYSFFFI